MLHPKLPETSGGEGEPVKYWGYPRMWRVLCFSRQKPEKGEALGNSKSDSRKNHTSDSSGNENEVQQTNGVKADEWETNGISRIGVASWQVHHAASTARHLKAR